MTNRWTHTPERGRELWHASAKGISRVMLDTGELSDHADVMVCHTSKAGISRRFCAGFGSDVFAERGQALRRAEVFRQIEIEHLRCRLNDVRDRLTWLESRCYWREENNA